MSLPPKRADAFLAWFCPPELLEDIQGDLYELYEACVQTHGAAHAARWYWWNVLWFLRPYILRRRRRAYPIARGPIMWKNYLLVALRSMRKAKLDTSINIFGLAVGLAVCLLITLFVRDELSYDRFFTHADRIQRVTAVFEAQQVYSEEARLTAVVAPLMANDFPEVEEATRLFRIGDEELFSRNDQRFYYSGVFFADSNFFAVFDFALLGGDPATALAQPNQVVLTQSVAAQFFGATNPIGQTLTFDGRADLTVSGVLADLPSNTHFQFDVLISEPSMASLYGEGLINGLQSWGWPSTYTYLLLQPGTNATALAAKFPDFMQRNEGQNALSLYLQPLTDIHLHSQMELEMAANGSMRQVYTFGAVALLILIIACINFMNLSTARFTLRAKEVGMRKVVGAARSQLITQFLSQSVVMTVFSLALALVLVWVALPWFNAFTGKALQLGLLANPLVPLSLLTVGLVVGLFAGSYPAFFLSRAKPLAILQGRLSTQGSGVVRRVLVVTQFAISIVLIIATAVVFAQIRFASSLDLGYEKEQTVVINGLNRTGDADARMLLRDRLLQHPNITAVTSASLIPTDEFFAGTGFRRAGDPADSSLFMRVNAVDFEYFETFGIDMVAGRGFSRDFGTDFGGRPTEENPHVETALILNESAAQKAGWSPEEAIGKQFVQGPGDEWSITYNVVGVARDIYFSSVHTAIEPAVFFVNPRNVASMAVRLGTADMPATLAFIDQTWAEMVPTYPITRTFLDDRFAALYEREQREATVFTSFSLLAILIACLGLLGLAAFIAERRRKEIGVRKVLGASVRDIVTMLSWDFTKLVIIANVIAWPVAWFFMRAWLDDFAYSAGLSVWVFLMASVVVFAIAWGTVGMQAGRAALVDPARTIRDE